MFYFDPVYLLFILPAVLLAGWAQLRVRSTFAEAGRLAASSRLSGAEAASGILRSFGLGHVRIEMAGGFLGDHYDPRKKVLRLSPEVYQGRSLAALGVAAHEAGHAIQDARRYAPLIIRNAAVPLAQFGSNFSWLLLAIGLAIQSMNLVLFGVLLFSAAVFFQVVNLPVEFDASSRAKEILVSKGFILPREQQAVARVLNAAALTYVAATVTAVLQLLYMLLRSGLLNQRE